VSTPGVVGVEGSVVVVDVIRAFSAAVYAFGAGARCIDLVSSVQDALAFGHRLQRICSAVINVDAAPRAVQARRYQEAHPRHSLPGI
jgi:hypothetical protein